MYKKLEDAIADNATQRRLDWNIIKNRQAKVSAAEASWRDAVDSEAPVGVRHELWAKYLKELGSLTIQLGLNEPIERITMQEYKVLYVYGGRDYSTVYRAATENSAIGMLHDDFPSALAVSVKPIEDSE